MKNCSSNSTPPTRAGRAAKTPVRPATSSIITAPAASTIRSTSERSPSNWRRTRAISTRSTAWSKGAPACSAPLTIGRAAPILVHGDAAFSAQGVVAEVLNLQGLAGYATGGTIHLIANNQVGFTTDPRDGRSTRYASDLAKGFDVPIVHVNADDVEACMSAVHLAVDFRRRFGHGAL